ncbi:KICSTOR complex protein kaptin-like [Ostrea edulis]|uniref:KICSTOR complex protein kaptin-like n=1 Tax=Ostrea edulis TaxID=37623 RepID=UPI0024AF8A41|nr:KICSTOR complex protein kaptin-like [Ostrea edulis]
MSKKNWKWSDANFSSLPSHENIFGITTTPQTNIYLHSKVLDPDGANKIIIASLAGKIVVVEYQRNFDNLIPSTKEIHFTYLPGDAELISLDVISKFNQGSGIIVGITFIKQKQGIEENDSSCTQYLNIYSSCEPGEESHLDSIAQGCLTIDLDFVPYQLTHTQIISEGKKEDVFLLGGSDNRVHLYKEGFQHRFREEDSDEFFPEFQDLDSCVQWLDIVYYETDTRRLTATGHQSGLVRLTNVDADKKVVLYTLVLEHDSPITSVRIFNPVNNFSPPSFLKSDNIPPPYKNEVPVFHLLVVSALSPAVVHRDVLNKQLKDRLILPGSNSYDIPLCVCVMDVDFDGQNELLVGTYGQELLAYKFVDSSEESKTHDGQTIKTTDSVDDSRNRHKSNECKHSIDFDEDFMKTNLSRKTKSQENISTDSQTCDSTCLVNMYDNAACMHVQQAKYNLLWQKSFSCPVIGVDRLDIVGDGLDDLIVVTLKGIHIVQPDLFDVAKVCSERLKLLAQLVQDSKHNEKDA